MMFEKLSLLFAVLVFPGGLFVLAVGLGLKGIDRRLAARLQRRVGPPLLQPFYDLIKLARKRTFLPDTANRQIFLGTPAVGLVAMLVAAALIPIPGFYQPDPNLGDLLVLFYLLLVPAVALMLAGSSSGSTFGGIGLSREMALMLAYEPAIVLVLVAVALRVGSAQGTGMTFSLTEIVAYQQVHGSLLLDPVMWPVFLAFLAFLPANLNLAPFDIPEAETEILEGPLLEYSGPALGLFKMMAVVKMVVVLSLGICLFLPIAPEGLAGLAIHLVKLAVLAVFSVTVLRLSLARMRIDQAFRFFLKWPLPLAATGLAAVILV